MKSAIVTGGTGFLGRHLVDMLAANGWDVIVFSRTCEDSEKVISGHVTYRSVDITDLKKLDAAFEQVDVVFHCAALSSTWGSYHSFYRVNVEGTRNVLKCCERHQVKKLVYVSSTSVYFQFEDAVNIQEGQPLPDRFANSYAETKFLGEQVVLNEKSQVEVVIIRPRGIVGDGDKAIMPRILRVAKSGYFPLLRSGQAVVDITYVKNVAHALLLCAEVDHIDGEIFNISNGQPMTVRELLDLVFHARSVKYLTIPYQLLHGMAWLCEWFAQAGNKGEPRLTVYSVGLLAHTQTLDIDKARTVLGYEAPFSLEYGVEQYLAWESGHA